jgi:hypothetical protein
MVLAGETLARLFTKDDLPSQGNRAISAYFIVLLLALGIVLCMMPGPGFGSF